MLACGKAPWAPRRVGGHDLFWWLAESGFLRGTVESLPSPNARLVATVTATGHGGGHDLHLRTLQAMGVTLAGHFVGADHGMARFQPDLSATMAWGDARYHDLMQLIRKTATELGLPPVDIDEPTPFDDQAPGAIPLAGFGAVIFAGGFRPDYRSWLPWPDAFDDLGFPIQTDGRSSVVDDLYFVGVPFLRTRQSSLLLGVGEDAALVARAIGAHAMTG